MTGALSGKTVALLATDGVEQVELTTPWDKLRQAGAKVELVSLESGSIRGYHHLDKGDSFSVDKTVNEVTAEQFDALVLPGGLANPDALRLNTEAVDLVKHCVQADMPVAAICHAPWLLVEAGVAKGRTMTSFPSLRTDIQNGGGHWVDQAVHQEAGIITSRKPDDLEQFCDALIAALG